MYRPTDRNFQYLEELCLCAEKISRKFKNAVLWIGGDLNLPDINWKTMTIEGHAYPKCINERFLECLENCGLQQMVTFPTRLKNTLDLFLTNRPSLVNKCAPLPGIGDHEIVYTESGIAPQRCKPVKRKIHLWKKASTNSMKEQCYKFQQDFCVKYSAASPIHQMWSDIKSTLLAILDKGVPSKMTSSRFNQPWITRSIKRLTRRKKRSFTKARKTKCSKDFQRYQQLKKTTRSACKRAYSDFLNNIISPESTTNPKKFWGFIKSKKCDNSGVSPLKANNGVTYSDSMTKANILNTQFSSVFNKNEDKTTIKNKGPSPYPSMDSITVSTEGVQKLLDGLNIHKASGPDGIPSRLLKELSHELAPVLALFFQASINQGILPDDWKKANVVPIFKKGERNKAENYRPVSLTSIICKTLEHVLCSQILGHCDLHNILTDAQFGFRKRRSCETQLLLTIQDLASNIDVKGQTDAIFLDFSKAFDKVPHERLLHKLNYYGIGGNINQWVRNFLENRTQQVTIDGAASQPAPVLSGVPQGSVLGPLLFLLFINDLPDCVSPGTTARLFADDCVLYRNIKTEEDATILQQDLDHLQQWESDWKMEFHPKKCQAIHCTNKKQFIQRPYTIHNHTLEEVDSAKYLGVNIHKTLSWNHHINSVTNKANSTRAFLQRNIYQCPRKTKELCYKTLVRPIVEYSSIIWDPLTATYIHKLEMVQRRYARFVCGEYRTTSSVTAMINQLQWPTLQERRAQAKATMMYRIVNNIVDVPHTFLTPTVALRGHSSRFHIPFARIGVYRQSFFPDSIRIWNELPQALINCTSLESFKHGVQSVQLR